MFQMAAWREYESRGDLPLDSDCLRGRDDPTKLDLESSRDQEEPERSCEANNVS